VALDLPCARGSFALYGLLQYLGPKLQFLIGVLVYDEPFTADRAIGFALIWLELPLYSGESLWQRRRTLPRPALIPVQPARGIACCLVADLPSSRRARHRCDLTRPAQARGMRIGSDR
jgi:hypothetical protein